MERPPPSYHSALKTTNLLTKNLIKMKIVFFKIIAFVLFFALMGAGCKKDEIQYADESIEISSLPGISIYKTNKDYRDKLSIGLDNEGNISRTPLFGNDPNVVKKNSNGDYVLLRRYLLKSGYICEDIYLDEAFTDITITEMVLSFEKNDTKYWSTERYKSRVIDKDPFSEFYYLDGINKPEKKITLGEINKMIESGTLETVFTKLK